MEQRESEQLLELTAHIVVAYVSNNAVGASELPQVIDRTFDALRLAEHHSAEKSRSLEPAVQVNKSITPHHLVCLECGGRYKSLKRHLSVEHGLSPDEYRSKWNLSAEYPTTAPTYAAARSALARRMGLGRKTASR